MSTKQIIDNAAEKYAPGDSEFKKVLQAIALAESGGNANAVGDNGNSIGLFQNNMAGGRGAGYTKAQLLDPTFNADIAASDLYKYYRDARGQGLSGANLVAYVSKNGQRPAAGLEWNAAKNYGKTVGDTSAAINEQTVAQQAKQTPQDNKWNINNVIPKTLDLFNLSKSDSLINNLVPQAYAEGTDLYSKNYSTAPQNYSPYPTTLNQAQNQYTVKSGDTLWDIAQKYLGNGSLYPQLGYTGNPRTLQIGTKLTIPNKSSQQPNTSTANGPVYTPPPTQNYSPVQTPAPNTSSLYGGQVYTPPPAVKNLPLDLSLYPTAYSSASMR